MTKNDFIIPAVFGLILVAIYLASLDWISPPSLTVKFYGKPVANAPVLPLNTSVPNAQTDKTGTISSRKPGVNWNNLHINLPDGSGAFLRFPEYGNKTVDYRGPKTILRTEVYYFGLLKTTEESSMYHMTDKQSDAIKAGKITVIELEEQIDRSIEQQMTSAT